MGWTCTHREKGEYTNLEWFRKEGFHRPEQGYELLDLAAVGFTELYGAYKIPDGRVVGLVILTHWKRVKDDAFGWADDFNYCWKEMDESMGPGAVDCPKRILDLLTPHDGRENEYAREWRAECWKRHIEKPKVTKGRRLRFTKPITFTDGLEADTFEFVKRTTFKRLLPLDFTPEIGEPFYHGGLVRITRWADREYEVVA